MEVNDELIENLANLARLHFDKVEKEEIKMDLQRMITFVEPLIHMSETMNVLREDILQGSVSREEALKNAPATDGIYFKVPKVIGSTGN